MHVWHITRNNLNVKGIHRLKMWIEFKVDYNHSFRWEGVVLPLDIAAIFFKKKKIKGVTIGGIFFRFLQLILSLLLFLLVNISHAKYGAVSGSADFVFLCSSCVSWGIMINWHRQGRILEFLLYFSNWGRYGAIRCISLDFSFWNSEQLLIFYQLEDISI